MHQQDPKINGHCSPCGLRRRRLVITKNVPLNDVISRTSNDRLNWKIEIEGFFVDFERVCGFVDFWSQTFPLKTTFESWKNMFRWNFVVVFGCNGIMNAFLSKEVVIRLSSEAQSWKAILIKKLDQESLAGLQLNIEKF